MCTVPLLSLHDIAASRGDGLRPEFLALFERLAAASGVGPTVVELSRYQPGRTLHSGPISPLPENATLPEGVLRFSANPNTECTVTDQRPDASSIADAPQRR